MFQFGGFPTLNYGFIQRSHGITREGFPHSDICGSQAICASPQLFAAYRVLLRLLMPRHSPCALLSLNFFPSLLHEFRKSVIFAYCSILLPILLRTLLRKNHYILYSVFTKFIILFFLLSYTASRQYTVCSICFLLFCCHCPLGSLSADIP